MVNKTYGKNDVKILQQRAVYDNGFLKVNEFELTHKRFDGSWQAPVKRVCVGRFPAVGVLPYDPQNQTVVLIEQFRVGALFNKNPWCLEIVAGVIDSNETKEAVAKRELFEEAGLVAEKLQYMYEYVTSAGANDEVVTAYCAKVDSQQAAMVAGVASEAEDIKIHVVPLSLAFDLLESGKIDNSLGIIALQWLKLNYQTTLADWH